MWLFSCKDCDPRWSHRCSQCGSYCGTASFYGVNFVVMGGKSAFRMTPSFFKTALWRNGVPSNHSNSQPPRLVGKIQEYGVKVFALSEHAQESFSPQEPSGQVGIVLGAEARGSRTPFCVNAREKLPSKALENPLSQCLGGRCYCHGEALFTPLTKCKQFAKVA